MATLARCVRNHQRLFLSPDLVSRPSRGKIAAVCSRPLRIAPDDDADSVNTLVELVAGGNQEAFAQLFDEVGSLVYGIVLRVVTDRAMSEEVAQEVFVQIWREAPRFDRDRGNARSWIVTIAHRRAVDRVRSEQARRRRESSDHEATAPAAADAVGDLVADRSEANRVHQALQQLPVAQREVVTLAYFGGKTYREAATTLGIPEGTAKTRIRDGLRRLRSIMEAKQ